jgi:hypothetical protein
VWVVYQRVEEGCCDALSTKLLCFTPTITFVPPYTRLPPPSPLQHSPIHLQCHPHTQSNTPPPSHPAPPPVSLCEKGIALQREQSKNTKTVTLQTLHSPHPPPAPVPLCAGPSGLDPSEAARLRAVLARLEGQPTTQLELGLKVGRGGVMLLYLRPPLTVIVNVTSEHTAPVGAQLTYVYTDCHC